MQVCHAAAGQEIAVAEIINLRQERKRRERRQQDLRAAENRAKSGLRKTDKALQKDERDRQRTRLDGHKRDEDR